jgi:hypothetical protein
MVAFMRLSGSGEPGAYLPTARARNYCLHELDKMDEE